VRKKRNKRRLKMKYCPPVWKSVRPPEGKKKRKKKKGGKEHMIV